STWVIGIFETGTTSYPSEGLRSAGTLHALRRVDTRSSLHSWPDVRRRVLRSSACGVAPPVWVSAVNRRAASAPAPDDHPMAVTCHRPRLMRSLSVRGERRGVPRG